MQRRMYMNVQSDYLYVSMFRNIPILWQTSYTWYAAANQLQTLSHKPDDIIPWSSLLIFPLGALHLSYIYESLPSMCRTWFIAAPRVLASLHPPTHLIIACCSHV